MKVYIRTRTVGSCFGTIGQVVSVGRRHRVLAEGDDVVPYGFTAAAVTGARRIAAQLGHTIVEEACS